MPTPTYNHTPAMGEISGMGGDYEETCQHMLHADVTWILENPGADVIVATYEDVTGVIHSISKDALKLEQVLIAACGEERPTGFMMHSITMRCMYVATNGWDNYVAATMEQEKDRRTIANLVAGDDDEFENLVNTLKQVFGDGAVFVLPSNTGTKQ